MLFISCFASLLLVSSELKRAASYSPPPSAPDESLVKVAIEFPGKVRTQCPASFSRSLLFVSTVDGRLTCINAKSGQPLWIFDSNEPLISSTFSSIEAGKDLRKTRFIPSFDGNLFKWNGRYLESVPLSSEYLLGQMKKLPDGSFIVGGNNVAVYGIDMESGKVLYESSRDGCKPTEKKNINEKVIMSLRRSQHVVRAVNRLTGSENWNYSVGKYEIELAGESYDLPVATPCGTDSLDLHFSIHDGIITNAASSSRWTFQLESPIADAWHLENKSLKSVDVFKYGLLETVPGDNQLHNLMYLGFHKGQLYIQEPKEHDRIRRDALEDKSDSFDLSQWRPFISSSPSRTPTLNNDKQTTDLSILDYPFDNGFVLSNVTPTAISVLADYKESDDIEDVCDIGNGSECKSSTSVPLTLKDWWIEILVMSILIAVGLNIGVKCLKRKFGTKLLPVLLHDNTEHISEFEPKKSQDRSFSTKHDSTKIDLELPSLSSGYESRYIDDFEHLECLGKGGFGVVFKAKKKIDYCEYAIKRIFLPHCEEAKKKMMREVRALAALDHPGIVRYFHAWWEEPPPGWQSNTDKSFLMKDVTSSYALSQDWVIEVAGVSGSSNLGTSATSSPEKKKFDDPLGKRFNFDTGVEDVISDHKEFDLLKHNDVFYPDSDSDINLDSNISNDFSDESFDIVFDANCSGGTTGDSGTQSKSSTCNSSNNNSVDDRKKTLTAEEVTAVFGDKSETSFSQSSASNVKVGNTKKRLVGKCCARNSSCLTEPPLFLYIQMQLCKRETLKDWLKNRTGNVNLFQTMDIFKQIVNAVKYFHQLGLMHRDLKPANILFSLDGSVKVGDFGLVTAITRPSIGKYKGVSFQDENHTGQVGTQLYMSPEQASGMPYDHKVDIYSLGLIFFELISSFSTQMERMQVIYKLKQGVLPTHLHTTPQGKLVQVLTAENPDIRPEAKDIIEHEYIIAISNITSESKTCQEGFIHKVSAC